MDKRLQVIINTVLFKTVIPVMPLLVYVTVSTLMWGMNVNYALMTIMEMQNNKIVAVSVLNNLYIAMIYIALSDY